MLCLIFQGLKNVENFIKQQQELKDFTKKGDPEDVEYSKRQLEIQQNLLASYTTVERIVDVRYTEGGAEYFIKWKNLPYSEATWEAGKVKFE